MGGKLARPITRSRLITLCENWEESAATNLDELDEIAADYRAARDRFRLSRREVGLLWIALEELGSGYEDNDNKLGVRAVRLLQRKLKGIFATREEDRIMLPWDA